MSTLTARSVDSCCEGCTATGESRGQDVARTIVGDGSKNLVELTVDGQDEKIVATDGHRFWSPGLKEWVRADKLSAGQLLQTSAGTVVQIAKVRKWRPVGATGAAVTIRGNVGHAKHGIGATPCRSCQALVNHFDIDWLTGK
jgi:hypothetical protein